MKIKLPKLFALVIFWFFLALYIYSACPYNSGYADSDEVVTTSHLLSVMHPSGYPLQVVLGKLFTLIPFGSIAFRVNIMSSFLQSLVLVFVFLIGLKILAFEKKQEKYVLLASLFGTIFLGLTPIFWLYGAVAEVFPLNNLFMILSIWFAIKWKEEELNFKTKKNKNKKYVNKNFFLTSVFLGLGLSHLHTFIMVFPAFLLLFIKTVIKKYKGNNQLIRKNLIIKLMQGIIIIIFTFFFANLILLYLNSRQEIFSWYFPQSFQGFLNHILRKVYSENSFDSKGAFSAYLSFADIRSYIYAIPRYFIFLFQHFSYIGIIFILTGFYNLFKKSRDWFWFFLCLFLFVGIIFAIYMGVDNPNIVAEQYFSKVALKHRLYLSGELILGIIGMFGFKFLFEEIRKFFKKEKNYYLGIILFGLLINVLAFLKNKGVGIQRENRIAYEYARAVLDSAEEGSVIICTADFPCFSLFYVQEVEKYKPSVRVLSRNRFSNEYFLKKNPEYLGFFYDKANDYFANLVSWNVSKRTTYITDAFADDLKYIGINDGVFFLIPRGYLFELTREIPDISKETNYDYTQRVIDTKVDSKDYWKKGIKNYLAYVHLTLAKNYKYLGDEENSYKNAMLSYKLNPSYIDGLNFLKSFADLKPNKLYVKNNKAKSSDEFRNDALTDFKNNNLNKAVLRMHYAVLADPLDNISRELYADVALKLGLKEAAIFEYKNIVKFEPENDRIKQKLMLIN